MGARPAARRSRVGGGLVAKQARDPERGRLLVDEQGHGDGERAGQGYVDLVDLVAIVVVAQVDAEPQLAAPRSEVSRRRIRLPLRFDVSSRRLCEAGYAAEAGRSLLPVARTLDEAFDSVGPFADPLLDRTACGRCNPHEHHGDHRSDTPLVHRGRTSDLRPRVRPRTHGGRCQA